MMAGRLQRTTKRRCAVVLAALIAAWLTPGLAPAGVRSDTVTLESLLHEIADLDRLTVTADPAYTTALASSYDRASVDPGLPDWFANIDRDNYIRSELNQGRTEYVMMDALGPGAVTRIWVANPTFKTVRVYIDGAAEPAIEASLKELLSGELEPFYFPLAHVAELGWNLYFPIPYAVSCKITVEPPQSWFFYHVSYRTYEPTTTVESFSMTTADSLRRQIRDAGRALVRQPLGGVFADSTGNRIDGRFRDEDEDSVVGASGRVAGAVEFNGDGDHVDLFNPSELPAGTSARSLCAWAKAGTTEEGGRVIVSYGSPGAGQAMFLGMNGTTLLGGAYGSDLTSPAFWDTTDWHHVCLTYDGTTAWLYGDGQLLQWSQRAWNLQRNVAYIGRQVNDGESWLGSIDEVRIVDSALSHEWIATTYANQGSPSTFYSIGTEVVSPLPGWGFRKTITVDHGKVAGAGEHDDFPLLISTIDPDLRTVAHGGKVRRDDGDDITFTLPDGTTVLDRQIERYEPTSGELVAWVEVPTISAVEDTVVHLHYGNPANSLEEQHPSEVWKQDYVAVWHLDASPDDLLAGAKRLSGQLSVNGEPLVVTPGPGSSPHVLVRELRFKPLPADEQTLRSTLLEITFDGQTTVRTPLGDFFGTGPGLNSYDSLPMSVDEDGTLVARWPMPFQNSMTVELSSVSVDPATVEYELFWEPHTWSGTGLYFHAGWRADHAVYAHPSRDWNLVEVQGGGRYVGTLLNAVNPYVDYWWGEGDEKIWVDGDSFPRHFGTGTEDYFGYAFGGAAGPFQHPYHALTRVGANRGHGRISVNRWRVVDSVTFEASLRVDIEQLFPAIDSKAVVWDATSYWYATPGATSNLSDLGPDDLTLPAVPPLFEKKLCGIVVEGESMEVLSQVGVVIDQVMSVMETEERLWSDHHQAFGRDALPGEQFLFGFEVETAGEYEIEAYLTRALDYAIFQPYINGEAAGGPIDLFGADGVEPTEGIPIGTFDLPAGPNTLAMEVVGQNPGNPFPDRYRLGVDALTLRSTAATVVAPTLTVGTDELTWTTASPATVGYDVVQGDLGLLLETGDFGPAVDACLADDHEDTWLPYTQSPPLGQTSFFLVGDVCTGTFDAPAGQLESRDPGIDASPHACP
jgi:hypothetical protein